MGAMLAEVCGTQAHQRCAPSPASLLPHQVSLYICAAGSPDGMLYTSSLLDCYALCGAVSGWLRQAWLGRHIRQAACSSSTAIPRP